MPNPGLASLGAGISETFFGGWRQQQKDEQDKKDEELARQLAAYHALLEHPDTPESEVPNILDAQAKLLKAEKEFAPVTAHMREAMKRQVPYGPEKQTGQSASDRIAARGSAIPQTTTEGVSTIQNRPTLKVPDGSTVSTAPVSVTNEAVASRVPPEPQMYQPTTEYGNLTQGEAQDMRKGELYGRQQEEMLKRQLAIQQQVAEGAAEKERIRVGGIKKLEELKQTNRVALVQKTYEEKTKMLAPAAQAKTESERLIYRNSLIASGMNENDANVASYQLFKSQVDADLANRQQKKAESQERMKRMGVMNAESFERIRKSKEGTGLTAGMTAGAAREYTIRTRTLQDQLGSVLRQLEAAYKEAAGVPDAAQQTFIDHLEQEKTDLWESLDTVRNELLTRGSGGSSVPSAPTVTPKSDPLGLFKKP